MGAAVPRFAPRVTTAMLAITTDALPDGPIPVPCRGTFPDLDTLAEHFPVREIVGVGSSADRLREEFLGQAPAGPWEHRPRARHLVARRAAAARMS